ncbi:endonuclease [Actinokineospora guangxiensis]|uniref:Endonuclease n=1 Tax=Actinokineospora guangxiensis TaxID=1490288 RepID=A0ABW0EQF1_9PSEU
MGRWTMFAPVVGAALVAVALHIPAGSAAAAGPLTVAQAIGQQGTTGTVRGYVVGQPTATATVVTTSFPSDYAIALADSPAETSPARMLYVQVTSGFRAEYGLRSNPDVLGDRLDVTGPLRAYFSHPGLTSPTAIAPAAATPPTTTPPPGGGGDYDDTYYRTAMGLTGQDLKDELHEIIKNNTKLSYSQVWDALKVTDQDPVNANNVVLLYSGRSQSKSTNGGNADDWNREHVWPQSHGDFGTSAGPGTDIHHLRPEDVTVNSTRGNKDFDNGGSPVSEAPDSNTDADSFEPRDAVKGDVARMIFYMAVRYAGTDGFADLELNNSTNNGSAPYVGKLSVLLAWNSADPPDAFEQRRNQVIHDQFQNNRNPFIDHPEWAAQIWG